MRNRRAGLHHPGVLAVLGSILFAGAMGGCATPKAVVVDDPGLFGDPDVHIVGDPIGRPGGIGDPDLIGPGDPIEREIRQEVRQEGRQEIRQEMRQNRNRKFRRGL